MTKTTVNEKLLQLKAILGDKAAQSALEKAESNEKAADEAGVDFKEVKTKAQPTNLSELLEQIDAGLESGAIVNDLEEVEPEADPVEDEKALKELIGEVLDEKLTALVDKLGTKEAKPADEAKTKEINDKIAALTKELAELNDSQPKQRPVRASQSDETVRQKGAVAETPQPDPVLSFISDHILMPTNGQNQP